MDIKEREYRDADDMARYAADVDAADEGVATDDQDEPGAARHVDNSGQRYAAGILDLVEDGYGFMRRRGLMPGPDDIYVSSSHVRRFGLRAGDRVAGIPRPPKKGEKYWGLVRVDTVNGMDPLDARRRPHFDELTPIHPIQLINLEADPKNLSQRLVNLVNPIGKGQRALIVSPPKAGKTMLLKAIANGISTNYPEILLMVALIGERPEEVTDMRRSVKGEVISSTFDEPTENHTHVAEMALEIAKRQVESGRDVVILLDSITRLSRAYNLALPPSGRTLTGGIDPVALYPPKRFFGAARKLEEGGSLTIRARWPLPSGLTRLIRRWLRFFGSVSRLSSSIGWIGVRTSKCGRRLAVSGSTPLTDSTRSRPQYFSPSLGCRMTPPTRSPARRPKRRTWLELT